MRQADSVSPTAEVQPARVQNKEFRPDIEGLRAVAVVSVVLFHADIPGVGGGFVGVDVFFVISGFLITGLLWREVSSNGTVGLRRFYGARARRLLPASAVVGIVIMLGSAAMSPVLQSRSVFIDGIASALYVGNYRFILQGVDYMANAMPSPFQHFWSLAVEEQFYLVWPPLIIGTAWLIGRVRRHQSQGVSSERPYLLVLALVAAASFAMSLVFTRVVPPIAFFSLPTRAWELAVGGLVALTVNQWRRLSRLPATIAGCAGLGVILLACTRLGQATPYPGTAALLPVLGSALVIGAGCAIPGQGVGRLLAVRPMRAIGRVSYSWYLWHWPLLQVVPPSTKGHSLSQALTAVFVSLGLAVLTVRFIENPLRFAAPLRRSANRSLALGGAATALAVCVGVALLLWMPVPVGRGPAVPTPAITSAAPPMGSNIEVYDAAVRGAFAQVQAAVAASVDQKAVPSNLKPPFAGVVAEFKALHLNGCLRDPFQSGQPECATADTASTTTVALVGDSNAAMWNPAFQQIAAQRHWRLETLTRAACPLLDLSTVNPINGREYTECDQWRGQIISRLQSEHPRLVVLSMTRRYGGGGSSTRLTSYDPAWIASLNRLVQQLRGTGAKVLVLGPIPDPQSLVPDCLTGHLDDATACSPPRSKAVNEAGITAEWATTKAAGGEYADLTDLFCTADRCAVIVGNILVYMDEAHVTIEYSRLLAPVIELLADRTFAGS